MTELSEIGKTYSFITAFGVITGTISENHEDCLILNDVVLQPQSNLASKIDIPCFSLNKHGIIGFTSAFSLS